MSIPRIIKERDFILLWLSQVVSQFGDKLNQMALVAWAYQVMPGSSLQISKLVFFTLIPVFVLGPFASATVDNLDKRRVLYISDAIRFLLILAIPTLILPYKLILPVYLVIFFSFAFGRFHILAKMSIVPSIVEKENIVAANSMLSTTGVIAAILGFAFGGIIVQTFGVKMGFFADAATFLFSAAFIYLIGKRYKMQVNDIERDALSIWDAIGRAIVYLFFGKAFKDIAEGIRYFFKHKNMNELASFAFIAWAFLGAIYSVSIAFVQESLGTSAAHLGFLVVALASGLLAGMIVVANVSALSKRRFFALYISFLLTNIALSLFTAVLTFEIFRPSRVILAFVVAFLMGVFAAPIVVISQTVVHETSENGHMAKVFGMMEIIVHIAFILAMFTSSLLADIIGKDIILFCIAGIGIIFSAARLRTCKRSLVEVSD